MQAIVQKIEEHANVLLDNKKDKINRHWSATRIIDLLQELVKVLPAGAIVDEFVVGDMTVPDPKRIAVLMQEIKGDAAIAMQRGDLAEVAAIARIRRNAVEMEVGAAVAASTFNELLQKCNYFFIGIPPPNVLVKD